VLQLLLKQHLETEKRELATTLKCGYSTKGDRPMAIETVERTRILEQIDRVTWELQELRRMLEDASPPQADLTARLLGSLGAEPIEDYDYHLEWVRFKER
jgi:hypothetical protein